MKHKHFFPLTSLLCVLRSFPLLAQAAETLSETAARFEKMGMPSAAGAVYSKITRAPWRFELHEIGGSGNAWKTSGGTTPEGRRFAEFIINGAETLRMEWEDIHSDDNKKHTATKGQWETARLRRGAAQVIRVVAEHEYRKTLTPEQRGVLEKTDRAVGWSYLAKTPPLHLKFTDTLTPGHLYLFALQLQQHGETEDAEVLAQRLASVFGAEAIEEAARIALSEALYRTALWRSIENGNWKQFYNDVQDIADKAPASWKWLPALHEMLLDRGDSAPLPPKHVFSTEEIDLLKKIFPGREVVPKTEGEPDDEH